MEKGESLKPNSVTTVSMRQLKCLFILVIYSCDTRVVMLTIDNIHHYGYETNHVSHRISIRSRGSILVSRV